MERGDTALRAFPMPVELQKWRKVHHGREKKVHADRGRGKNRIKTDNVQIKEQMSPGMGFFS